MAYTVESNIQLKKQPSSVIKNCKWTIVNKVDTIYKEKVPSTAA